MVHTKGVRNEIKSSAIELIGNTPIVALDRIYSGPGRILAKCEFMNPGASIKDRASFHMIQKARKLGALKPGGSVLEISSGNQGCGLAVTCAVLQHPLTVFMSEGNSIQRCIHMEALGAKCIRVPQVEGTYGKVTHADLLAAEMQGIKFAKETGAYYINQFHNKANSSAHYKTTGPEIWRQTGGRVDVFVVAVGTAGTFTGTSKFLKEKNPKLLSFVVEPEGSEPIKGDPITKPAHKLQGSGYGHVPSLLKFKYLDGTVSVTDEEAETYRQLLGEKEGLYVGYTSGANVAGALKLIQSGRVPKDAWIVTTLNDTGLKYSP